MTKRIAFLLPGACVYDTETERIIYRNKRSLIIVDKKGKKKVVSI